MPPADREARDPQSIFCACGGHWEGEYTKSPAVDEHLRRAIGAVPNKCGCCFITHEQFIAKGHRCHCAACKALKPKRRRPSELKALRVEVARLQGLLDRQQEVQTAAIKALERVEWRGNPFEVFSPVCIWCGGYERHPAMDQDYNGKPGHKPDCLRKIALEALRGAIPPSPQEPDK